MTNLERAAAALDIANRAGRLANANTVEAMRQCEGWKMVADGADLRVRELEEAIRAFRDCADKPDSASLDTLLDALGDPICLNCKQGKCVRHVKG